ncbi:MAG: O-antigen ligase family protein, partial [Acidimicrobiales bacterium]
AIGLAAVSHDGAPVRYFEHGVGDTVAYIIGPRDLGVRSTSIGARFEMWRSAAGGFRSEPLLGIGWGNLRGRFNADVDAGVRVPRIAQYNHAHNQFISSTASGGIVGLVTLLALLGVPGIFFARALLDRDAATSALGAAGLIVVVGFALFGLTEAILEKASPAVFYATTVALLTAQLDRRARSHSGSEAAPDATPIRSRGPQPPASRRSR